MQTAQCQTLEFRSGTNLVPKAVCWWYGPGWYASYTCQGELVMQRVGIDSSNRSDAERIAREGRMTLDGWFGSPDEVVNHLRRFEYEPEGE